jgi:hypothetical protein
MKERRGRRPKQLLDYFKKTRRYWKLKEKTLSSTVCSNYRGGGERAILRLYNDDVWNTALLFSIVN